MLGAHRDLLWRPDAGADADGRFPAALTRQELSRSCDGFAPSARGACDATGDASVPPMKLERIALAPLAALLIAAWSCGDCGANAGGAANGGGGGTDPSASGAGGAFGGGGSGGQGTPYPACSPDVFGDIDQRRMLLGEDGTPIAASLNAAVTVTAADGATIRLADAASSRRWTWSPNIPNLPANRINVGDRFDLTVEAIASKSSPAGAPCQTVVLARCGALVAFNSERSTPTCASLPPLDAWGISVTNAGPVCEHPSTDLRCDGFYFFATQVSTGSAATIVAPGQTIAIRGLSFSLREFSGPTDYGCDGARAIASMAGFGLP
jgi:hypothetical protein